MKLTLGQALLAKGGRRRCSGRQRWGGRRRADRSGELERRWHAARVWRRLGLRRARVVWRRRRHAVWRSRQVRAARCSEMRWRWRGRGEPRVWRRCGARRRRRIGEEKQGCTGDGLGRRRRRWAPRVRLKKLKLKPLSSNRPDASSGRPDAGIGSSGHRPESSRNAKSRPDASAGPDRTLL